MGCAPYGLFLYKRYLVTLDGFLGFNGLGSRQLLRRSQRVLGHIQRQARLGAEFIDFDQNLRSPRGIVGSIEKIISKFQIRECGQRQMNFGLCCY